MKSPCKDCAERYVGCHSGCEKYKDFRQELDKQRTHINKAKEEQRNKYRVVGGRKDV